MPYSISGRRVWIAGHTGMVGSALVRRLECEGCEILTASRQQLDLINQQAVRDWFNEQKPQSVFLAAAKVGGIHANNVLPAEFLYDNLMIETNIINAAHETGVEKLLFLGSSCIYPRDAAQPMTEDALLSGPLESTNEWYAIAKIAGIKLCQAYCKQYGDNFISAMPTNLYGPGDNFHSKYSHVPAALLRRFHEAKGADQPNVVVWGTGTPQREFLHVDDLADACVYLMQYYSGAEHINIGTGKDVTIRHFAEAVRDIVGFKGEIVFDATRPDGTPRKVLNVDRLTELGWTARIPLADGLEHYYAWFLKNQQTVRQ